MMPTSNKSQQLRSNNHRRAQPSPRRLQRPHQRPRSNHSLLNRNLRQTPVPALASLENPAQHLPARRRLLHPNSLRTAANLLRETQPVRPTKRRRSHESWSRDRMELRQPRRRLLALMQRAPVHQHRGARLGSLRAGRECNFTGSVCWSQVTSRTATYNIDIHCTFIFNHCR